MSIIGQEFELTASDRILPLADGIRGTDQGYAIRFVQLHGDRIRYVREWGKWLVYYSGHWVIDANEVLVTSLAKDVSRSMFEKLYGFISQGIPGWDTDGNRILDAAGDPVLRPWTDDEREDWLRACKSAERKGTIAPLIWAARDMVAVEISQLDANPYLLNLMNGTLDLHTGKLNPHSAGDLCTKQCPVFYYPGLRSDLWESCLETWQPDADMRDYLQLEAGAALTGHPTETLSIHFGSGGNGKSKYFGALQYVLGDYAVVPHRSLVLQTKYEQHETEKAKLCGARLAVLPETGTQSKLNVEQVKNMTGGDKMGGRRMREDPWDFWPTHTLVMFCNHEPIIEDTSDGVWRRVRVVSWDVTIPEWQQDKNLAKKLEREAQGILNWAVAGAIRFIAGGGALPMPEQVAVATLAYQARENVPGRFIADCLEIGRSKNHRVPVAMVKLALAAYCADNGLDEPKWSDVTEALTLAGGETKAFSGVRYWEGFRLVSSGFSSTPGVDPVVFAGL